MIVTQAIRDVIPHTFSRRVRTRWIPEMSKWSIGRPVDNQTAVQPLKKIAKKIDALKKILK